MNYLNSMGFGAGLGLLSWWLFRPETETEEETGKFNVPEGKIFFEPSFEWQTVLENHVCPPGLEFKLDLSSGENLARIPPPEDFSSGRRSVGRRPPSSSAPSSLLPPRALHPPSLD